MTTFTYSQVAPRGRLVTVVEEGEPIGSFAEYDGRPVPADVMPAVAKLIANGLEFDAIFAAMQAAEIANDPEAMAGALARLDRAELEMTAS